MSLALILSFLSPLIVGASDAGSSSCADVEQRLAQAQRTLATCTESSRTISAARERCEAALDNSGAKQLATLSRLETCVQEREQQCVEAAGMAAALLQGGARGVGSCVPAQTLARVQALLSSWETVAKALAQLDEYASGATDVLPRVGNGTDAERHLQRLLGRQGSPLWHRRLLIEAFMLAAPEAFGRTKRQGSYALEQFFESHGPLPEALVTEAKGEHEGPVGAAGAPLSAALRLSRAYLLLARCDDRPDSKECGRAQQLVELLDATSPLLVRRRIEDLYATPCRDLKPDMLRGWLRSLPVIGKQEREELLGELTQATRAKLFLCYLGDSEGPASYRVWVTSRLPAPADLESRVLPVVDAASRFIADGDALDRCGRAVRNLQRLPAPKACVAPGPEASAALLMWAKMPPPVKPIDEFAQCDRIARLMWSGASLSLPESPTEPVHVDDEAEPTAMAQLRTACDERRGTGPAFEEALSSWVAIGSALGESVGRSPWRADAATGRPIEKSRAQVAARYESWLKHVINQESACDALSLAATRCEECSEATAGTRYDCDAEHTLSDEWARYRRFTRSLMVLLAVLAFALTWGVRQLRARRAFAGPMKLIRESLDALGVAAAPDGWRHLFPSRHDTLHLELPRVPAWERWGTDACALYCPGSPAVREADVNHAAQVAQRESVRVVFLLHPDSGAPDLGAVRAILDWAARGGTRAVQVLPLALSRLAWATRDEDLLDLVESTTLRGNPFEVRGPVRSSSQFWNRERLVAGLLTEAKSGNWAIVTGLRRFGKSSLALEVARRVPGPSAYVDLAGFHHEVSHGETPAAAVEAVLRTLVTRLADSTAARYPAAIVPEVPVTALDAPTLGGWLRALGTACGTSAGTPPPPMLLVLDEVEQLLSQPPDKLSRALDVLATLVGRLRSAVSEPSSPHSGSTVGVVFCAALHPLLWAPLQTLGGQSLMGAFPSICVPALDDDAARAMMQGLGGQQGIRFDDDALVAMVRASHGVPLLLRRLGTSVLELYDADRARQGALGATRIGIEGATEAIRRETRGGSPLRVWVESEIASPDGSPGVMLRALAQEGRVTVTALQKLVETQVVARFNSTGLDAHLTPSELKRRAQEAASVMVRLLAESRLLEAHGDLTAPDSLSLPDGVLRQILGEGKKS